MPPRGNAASSTGTAANSTQKLSALSRGKAMSRAPIMIGTMKFPKGPVIMMIVAMIMMMPWRPTMALYSRRAEEA